MVQINMIDEIMRGLLSTPMESLDQFVTREVTNHLFEEGQRQYSGLDLVAINIQRGQYAVVGDRRKGVGKHNPTTTLYCSHKRMVVETIIAAFFA